MTDPPRDEAEILADSLIYVHLIEDEPGISALLEDLGPMSEFQVDVLANLIGIVVGGLDREAERTDGSAVDLWSKYLLWASTEDANPTEENQ
jgi:hypothetical protein